MAKKTDNAGTSDDFSLELTEQEKLELEADARKQVMADMKEAEKDRFFEAAKLRIQSEMLFRNAKDMKGEGTVTVDLLLASHPKYIMLDGTVYHSGKKHTVSRSVAAVLLETMHRGWEQEFARLSPEQRDNVKQQRNFILKRQGDGYGLVQV